MGRQGCGFLQFSTFDCNVYRIPIYLYSNRICFAHHIEFQFQISHSTSRELVYSICFLVNLLSKYVGRNA